MRNILEEFVYGNVSLEVNLDKYNDAQGETVQLTISSVIFGYKPEILINAEALLINDDFGVKRWADI